MIERILGDGKTVVHDFRRIVLRHSKGKGGRLSWEIGNEMVVRDIPLARIYNYNLFITAWANRTETKLIQYVDSEEDDARRTTS